MLFRSVRGNPADYFVVVEGSTRGLGTEPAAGEQPASESMVNGQCDLVRSGIGPDAAYADVSLFTPRAAPDPHRLSIVLFQRRSLAGLRLPPVRVSTFGVPDVAIRTDGGIQKGGTQ